MARELHSLVDLSNENEHRIWLEELRKAVNNLTVYGRSICLDTYISEIGRGANSSSIHGDLLSVSTGDALPAGYNVTVGHGKLVFVLNAGTDVSGQIAVTGTMVDRKTGETTTTFTEYVTVDRLSTDTSDSTLLNPTRTKYNFKNAYITSNWFTDIVSISSIDLTITDMDTYSIAFEQFNDAGSVTLDTVDATVYEINTAADFRIYAYSVVVTGNKVDIVPEVDLGFAAPTAANRYFRLRKTNIDKSLDTTKDGMFVTIWYNTPTSHIEDVTVKVWATAGE